MNADQKTLWQGIWAVTWRSAVYLPLSLLAFGVLLTLALSLVALPLLGLASVLSEDYVQAFALFAAWVVVLWAWRRFRLSRYYEGPPSYL